MRVISKEQLKERLRALAVFAGIGVGAVAGFEMIIGGGFDPLTPGVMYAAPEQTRAYENLNSPYSEARRPYLPTRYSVTPTIEPMRAEQVELALAGGPDVEIGPAEDALSERELRAEIEQFYAEAEAQYFASDEGPAADDLPAPRTVREDYSFADSDVAELTAAGGR